MARWAQNKSTKEARSINRKSKSQGNGVTAYQERCQANSHRLESDGVAVGTKSGEILQALLNAENRALALLDVAEATLAAAYSREAFLKRAKARTAYREACERRSDYC